MENPTNPKSPIPDTGLPEESPSKRREMEEVIPRRSIQLLQQNVISIILEYSYLFTPGEGILKRLIGTDELQYAKNGIWG